VHPPRRRPRAGGARGRLLPRASPRSSDSERAAEALEHPRSRRPRIGNDRVCRVLDLPPGLARRGGQALEGAGGLALPRLQLRELTTSFLAQGANPQARVRLDLLLRPARISSDLRDRLSEVVDALLQL